MIWKSQIQTLNERKCLYTGGYEGADKGILHWFLAKGNQNVLKGEVLLKRKSLDSAKQLDQPDFKGSDCWLSNRIKGSLLSGFLS